MPEPRWGGGRSQGSQGRHDPASGWGERQRNLSKRCLNTLCQGQMKPAQELALGLWALEIISDGASGARPSQVLTSIAGLQWHAPIKASFRGGSGPHPSRWSTRGQFSGAFTYRMEELSLGTPVAPRASGQSSRWGWVFKCVGIRTAQKSHESHQTVGVFRSGKRCGPGAGSVGARKPLS